ncbi:MAG: NAD-dependent epimerase/dehydratase family protein [Cyanobacteria bacterium P01_D01_bin.156]
MITKKALVVGASGGIGQNLVRFLSKQTDWEIVGLSRKAPQFESTAQFIAVDLLDRDDVMAKLRELADVTHIFYTAFYGGPTFSGPVAENVAQNLAIWPLGDFLFNCDWDVLLSSTKVQQAGFHSVVDSEEMFKTLFQNFRDRKIIPSAQTD